MKYEFKGSSILEARWLELDEDFEYELSSDGNPIAGIYTNGDTSEHNKNLFISAPDLLQAAINLIEGIELSEVSTGDRILYTNLKTAIYKALNIEV
jgi:hypothetical protein